MAYVVSAYWRAKEGKEQRLTEVIDELTAPSRAEPGNRFYQAQGSSRTRGSSTSTSSTRTRPPTRRTWRPSTSRGS